MLARSVYMADRSLFYTGCIVQMYEYLVKKTVPFRLENIRKLPICIVIDNADFLRGDTMSFKVNNPCKKMIARSYTSAFTSKRNPDMYSKKRMDRNDIRSTYDMLLGTSYSPRFIQAIEDYTKSEDVKKSPTADQTPESAVGVRGGYRSHTVMNNPYHADKLREAAEKAKQQQAEGSENQQSGISDILFDLKTRMNFML